MTMLRIGPSDFDPIVHDPTLRRPVVGDQIAPPLAHGSQPVRRNAPVKKVITNRFGARLRKPDHFLHIPGFIGMTLDFYHDLRPIDERSDHFVENQLGCRIDDRRSRLKADAPQNDTPALDFTGARLCLR